MTALTRYREFARVAAAEADLSVPEFTAALAALLEPASAEPMTAEQRCAAEYAVAPITVQMRAHDVHRAARRVA